MALTSGCHLCGENLPLSKQISRVICRQCYNCRNAKTMPDGDHLSTLRKGQSLTAVQMCYGRKLLSCRADGRLPYQRVHAN